MGRLLRLRQLADPRNCEPDEGGWGNLHELP
jgi:hypothetical protein